MHLFGYSGAGKSTAIDLFLGLLEPTNGSNKQIDGIDLKKIGIRRWQKTINYVPQSPIITNLSLRENIAFGVTKELIDDERVIDCLKQTDLFSLSQSLEKGIYTNLENAGTYYLEDKSKELQYLELFIKILIFSF